MLYVNAMESKVYFMQTEYYSDSPQPKKMKGWSLWKSNELQMDFPENSYAPYGISQFILVANATHPFLCVCLHSSGKSSWSSYFGFTHIALISSKDIKFVKDHRSLFDEDVVRLHILMLTMHAIPQSNQHTKKTVVHVCYQKQKAAHLHTSTVS